MLELKPILCQPASNFSYDLKNKDRPLLLESPSLAPLHELNTNTVAIPWLGSLKFVILRQQQPGELLKSK